MADNLEVLRQKEELPSTRSINELVQIYDTYKTFRYFNDEEIQLLFDYKISREKAIAVNEEQQRLYEEHLKEIKVARELLSEESSKRFDSMLQSIKSEMQSYAMEVKNG